MQRLLIAILALTLLCMPGAPTLLAQEPPPARARLSSGAATATVPFELYRRWMIVPVTVQDSPPLRFILDTGAPITVLASLALGQTLPLEIIGQARIGGAGEGEAAQLYVAGNVRMRLGEVDIEGASMAIGLGEDALGGADGVIGGPIFNNFVVEIDWLRQRLLLHDPTRWSPDPALAAMPLRRTATGHLVTTAGISVAGERVVPVDLFVDTGAGHALSVELAGVPALERPERVLANVLIGWGANGVAHGDIGRAAELRLGGQVLRQVVTTFPTASPWSQIGDAADERVFGNLGAQVLQRFHVIFDVAGGWLYLRPNELFDEPFGFDQAGLALLPGESGALAITVADVVAGSPAAEAGMLVGDEITAIDNRPVSELAPDEVQRIFEGAGGPQLSVTLRRGESVLEVQFVLRPLI